MPGDTESRPSLKRDRRVAPEPIDAIQRVSTLELFFDLVFVFTITQLTAVLVDDASWTTLSRVALMLGIIWWMYGGYAWLTNAVSADRASRRLLLLGGMAAYLVLALTIPTAFDDDGVAFGVAYLVIITVHAALSRVIGATILKVAPFNFGAAVLVVVGGAVGGTGQPVLWLLALLVLWGSSFLAAPEPGFEIGPAHFVERHGLVIIIAIGESVVAIGGVDEVAARFGESPDGGRRLLARSAPAAALVAELHRAEAQLGNGAARFNRAVGSASPERLGCRGHHLVVRDVAQVLADVPTMPEGIVELPVTVAPEHVSQRLADLRARRDGLRENRLGVLDLDREHDRRPADRGRSEHAHLRELVRDVHDVAADAQLHRHQPPVRSRNPLELLGAESIAVEVDGTVGALDDDVRSDRHTADPNQASDGALERSCSTGFGCGD
jgi:hypothetical protein